MKKRCLPAAVLLLSGSHSPFATELGPVIVTATRTAQTADETLSSVTVVTKKESERRHLQSLAFYVGIAAVVHALFGLTRGANTTHRDVRVSREAGCRERPTHTVTAARRR